MMTSIAVPPPRQPPGPDTSPVLTRRAGIYARISDDREGRGLGVARQRDDCEALIRSRGWLPGPSYVDNDISAYSGRQRPAYRQLLADARAGVFDAIVAWHPDRLHRSPREFEEFIDVCEQHGIAIETVRAGTVDLSTPAGRAVARTVSAWSRYESEHKSERIRRKHEELAMAGHLGGGGTRPYGFERDRVTVNPAEAAVIQEAARRLLAGETLHSVCADFNARAVPTSTGVPWRTPVLRRVLSAPRTRGQRQLRGRVVGPADWPAILSPEDGARLEALLTDPARRTNHTPRRYILSGGLLRCGICGSALVARPKSDKRRAYVCAKGPNFSGCGRLASLAEPLEDLIVKAVLIRLDTPELAAALARPPDLTKQPDALLQGLDDARQHIEELSLAYANRQITMPEWLAARRPIQARIDKATAALARSTQQSAVGDLIASGRRLRERWSTLSVEQRHAVLSAVLDHIVLEPALKGRNRFDKERVRPVWRA